MEVRTSGNHDFILCLAICKIHVLLLKKFFFSYSDFCVFLCLMLIIYSVTSFSGESGEAPECWGGRHVWRSASWSRAVTNARSGWPCLFSIEFYRFSVDYSLVLHLQSSWSCTVRVISIGNGDFLRQDWFKQMSWNSSWEDGSCDF